MTEAEDKDLGEMTTLILGTEVACVSAKMQVQIPGDGLSDPSMNDWQSEAFVSCNLVTAVKSPELTIHLQQIDRIVQSLLAHSCNDD